MHLLVFVASILLKANLLAASHPFFFSSTQNFLILLYESLLLNDFSAAYMKNTFSLWFSSYDLCGYRILSLSKPKTTSYGLNVLFLTRSQLPGSFRLYCTLESTLPLRGASKNRKIREMVDSEG